MMTWFADLIIPLLLIGGGLLGLLPGLLLPAHRRLALLQVVALLLATLLLYGVVQPLWYGADLAFALLGSGLIAAPLLERARARGFLVAALLGSGLLVYSARLLEPLLPMAPVLSLLLLVVVGTSLLGMVGGLVLPLHPRRAAMGQRLAQPMLAGLPLVMAWAALAAAVVVLAHQIAPGRMDDGTIAASLSSGLAALWLSRREPMELTLVKCGEGLMAGLLLTLLVPLGALLGVAFGVLAAFLVSRSEALAIALRMEDPHHLLGAMLLPAGLGLLLPGLLDMHLLAAQIEWLGMALILPLILSMLLWPVLMLVTGLALPPRLVREPVAR